VPFDPGLLEILPADVGGLPIVPEPEAFAASAGDPGLVRDAEAGVVGFVADPSGSDFAVAFVYRLRDGVFDETWFRDWRDSFDEGVCAQAGGVTGHLEAEVAGRETFIGTCAEGVLTHHQHLTDDDGDLVVSVQSVGGSRLGEQVVGTLRV
jgi:hypothetical protein